MPLRTEGFSDALFRRSHEEFHRLAPVRSSVLHPEEEKQMQAYMGVDWSASSVVCATAAGSGKPKRIAGARPSLSEVSDLVERVRARHPEAGEVQVLIEAGSPHWINLFHSAGAIVYVADARQAKKFAESLCSSGAKADQRDAYTLTEMLRSPAHRPAPWVPQKTLEPLQSLGTAHEQVNQELTRVQQQLRDRLRANMPLVDQTLKDLKSQWVICFLRAVPTPWHAHDLDLETLVEMMPRCRQTRRRTLWEALQRTEAPWMTEAAAKVEALRVEQLLARMELLMKQLGELDEHLDALTSDLPARKYLESIKGIGLRQAAALIQFAFVGELTHRDQAGIQLGASPVFSGSGETRDGRPKGHSRMRRAAHYRARRATYLLGRLAQQHLRWATAMYNDGRARGQSAATAYRRIARSLLRILTAMVRAAKPYDEDRYIEALKKNGVAWAKGL